MRSLPYMLVTAVLLITTTAHANDASAVKEDPDQKLICKSFQETGSLVKKRRVCATKKQWVEITANARKMVTDLQDPTCSLQSRTGGCME